jgi:hypothetical protein
MKPTKLELSFETAGDSSTGPLAHGYAQACFHLVFGIFA